MARYYDKANYIIPPNDDDKNLMAQMTAYDAHGNAQKINVINEKAHTLFLNGQEIVTNMTIGDHPEFLAVGYLKNQNMLKPNETITAIDHDEEIGVTIVRTNNPTNFEEKMKKKIRTSGCAQGTIFGDVMEEVEKLRFGFDETNKISHHALTAILKMIAMTPSLYLEAGAIHGCVLCDYEKPLVYMEDVGRHNAVDKLAGYMVMEGIEPLNKILYTTGRLTSEMVIKTIMMGIPILVSRSGFTAWGVDLAVKSGLTLIGRARGERMQILSGHARITSE